MLVVDDERIWRLILETDLRKLGYEVAVAEDADEALSRVSEREPEAAIVDLMLPEPVSGRNLPAAFRARGWGLPVIFYTAQTDVPDVDEDPDVVGCLSKAADRSDLYDLLPSAILSKRSRRPG